MKEHIYLENKKKSWTLAAILAAVTALLAIVGIITGLKVLYGFACLAALVLVIFTMHYVGYRRGETSVKKPLTALHLYAVHAILLATWRLFAGEIGTFSYGVLHALVDGSLAALLFLLACCLVRPSMGWLAVIFGIAAAVFSLLEITVGLQIVLIAAAAFALILALFGFKSKPFFSLFLILATVAVLLFSLLPLLIARHNFLHYIVLALGAFSAVGALAFGVSRILDAAPSAKSAEAPKQKAVDSDISAAKAKRIPTTAVTPMPDEDNDTIYNSKWVIKAYRDKPYSEIADGPVWALYGVSKNDAELLQKAFNIKTVRDLATNKFFNWAEEISDDAKATV